MVHLRHGVMGPAFRAEPVGTRAKIRLKNRLQHQLQGRLDHPIPRSRDAQPATLGRSRLRDHPLPHGQRAKAARLQLDAQPGEEPLAALPSLHLADRLAINPGRARPRVAPHPIPGHQQEAGITDEVVQIIEPAMRIAGCPAVQLGLDLPYPSLSPVQLTLQFVGVHRRPPGIPSSLLPTCWPPWPCTRLSHARTTTGPPSLPRSSAGDGPCPRPGWMPGRTGDQGRFPRSPCDRSTGEAPSYSPTASPRLRRRHWAFAVATASAAVAIRVSAAGMALLIAVWCWSEPRSWARARSAAASSFWAAVRALRAAARAGLGIGVVSGSRSAR